MLSVCGVLGYGRKLRIAGCEWERATELWVGWEYWAGNWSELYFKAIQKYIRIYL